MAFLKKIKIKEKNPVQETEQQDWLTTEGELIVDVFHTPKEIIVQAPVAGIKAEELDVSFENDILKIKGERGRAQEIKNDNYLLQECYWGSFSRSIILPEKINKTKIEATVEEGILTITLPKKKVISDGKIKVRSK